MVPDKASLEHVAERIARGTVPLYARSEGRLRLIGSGSLLGMSNEAFLITAAHVIDELRGGQLCTVNPFADSGPISLGREAPTQSDAEVHDIAIVPLGESLDPFRALTAGDLDFDADFAKPGRYHFLGWPQQFTLAARERLASLPIFCAAETYQGPTEDLLNYHSALHLLLDVNAPPAALFGLSGSPIWRIDGAAARAVAVETAMYPLSPERVLVRGTSFRAVLRLLQLRRP
jgi:hypothetical protein